MPKKLHLDTVETLSIGPYFKFDWAVSEFSKIIPDFLIEINTLNIDQPQVQLLVALKI